MMKLNDFCAEYNLSKSTIRRRYLELYPDKVIEQGKTIQLDVSESSAFADYLEKKGYSRVEPVQSDSVNQFDSVDDSSDSTPEPILNSGDVEQQIQNAVHAAVQKERLKQFESEIESLNKRIEYLESENERLHKVIEREQMNHTGFWNRLGQKLLPHKTSD